MAALKLKAAAAKAVSLLLLQLLLLTVAEAKGDNDNATVTVTATATPSLAARRDLIRNMTVEAWQLYRDHAWGHYAVDPVHQAAFPMWRNSGDTVVNSLTTLHLMGLTEQFAQARQWIGQEMNLGSIGRELVTYHLIAGHLGSLLSTYALTGDELFLNKAVEVAKTLESAFNTTTGLPAKRFIPKTGKLLTNTTSPSYAALEQPELHLLADLLSKGEATNQSAAAWRARLNRINAYLTMKELPEGVFPGLIPLYDSGKWDNSSRNISRSASLDGLTIEALFNLVRSYRLSGGLSTPNLAVYNRLVEAYQQTEMLSLVGRGEGGEQYIVTQYRKLFEPDLQKRFTPIFYGDACALGSLFAQAGRQFEELVAGNRSGGGHLDGLTREAAAKQWKLARGITRTCDLVANSTQTKLVPVSSSVKAGEGVGSADAPPVITVMNSYFDKSSKLAETYFTLWRLTREPVWRERSWALTQAIHAHLRMPGGGFSRVESVVQAPTTFRTVSNSQDPEMLSATLKYLYLTQVEDDSVLPLDKWVFNAYGHPLPVCGQHAFYPKSACFTADKTSYVPRRV